MVAFRAFEPCRLLLRSHKDVAMTDKQLLELAARACGIKLNWHNGYSVDVTGWHPMNNIHGAKEWNPLIDDGDALRIAVKLSMGISIPLANKRTDVCTFGRPTANQIEGHGSDPCAATRRAIVRAAAAIEEALE